MAGYDRAIRSEPHFEPGQAAGLIKDLTAYLQTLQVSPALLELNDYCNSAAANVISPVKSG